MELEPAARCILHLNLESYLEMARFPFSIPTIEAFAIPAVISLISFLSYSSQFLFYFIEPGPLSHTEALWFNVFVLGIWWCYNLACTTDPGPKGWVGKVVARGIESEENKGEDAQLREGLRWCKKCEAPKPPRAHHCRQCGRYVLQTLKIASRTDIMKLYPCYGPSLSGSSRPNIEFHIFLKELRA